MIFAGAGLAQRLEAADAANAAACARAQGGPGTVAEQIAGGWAVFAGVNSMLTHAIGLGLNGPVSAAGLDRVEAFYVSRGSPVNIDLCPLAHPSLIELLKDRGYRVAEFSNVLALVLTGMEPFAPDGRIRQAGPGEMELFARTAAAGFFEKREYAPEEVEVGRAIFQMPGARCFLGYAPGGEPAAAAAASVRDGLAALFGDSTAPQFRRAGLHAALIRERLNAALRAGCDMATASTLPGSISQRNYERLGFRVVYTKVGLTK